MELDEKQYETGFNSGYLMAKFEPQMLALLLRDIRPLNSYIQGMSSGLKEYELGKTNAQLDELHSLRQKNRDQRDRERD
jgi:hypothetical protein